MKRSIVYYMVVNPYDKNNTYVKASYTDGSIKYWYPQDVGYRSAKAKAMQANKR